MMEEIDRREQTGNINPGIPVVGGMTHTPDMQHLAMNPVVSHTVIINQLEHEGLSHLWDCEEKRRRIIACL